MDLSPIDIKNVCYYMYLFLCITIQATIKDAKMFVVFFFWNVMLHNTLDAGLYCYIHDQILLKWSILHIVWFWKKSTKTLLFDGNPRSNDKSVLLKMVLIGNFISEINGNRSQWTDTRSYNILPLQLYIRLNKLKYKYSTAENPFLCDQFV